MSYKAHRAATAFLLAILGVWLLSACASEQEALMVAPAAGGTTYYVDASGGSDTNSGTSTSSAWKTLAKVNGKTFQPGDKLLFEANGIWNGRLWPKGSGSSGVPIIIDRYGNGSKPVINGGGTVLSALYLYNQEYWEVGNLELTNSDGSTSSGDRKGVYIEAEDAGTLSHLYLRNLYVHDVNGSLDVKESGGIIVKILGSVTKTKFDDLRIENNTIENVASMGISTDSRWANRGTIDYGSGGWYPSTNVRIRNNFISRTGRNCVVHRANTGALVEYNVFAECARLGTGNSVYPFNTDGAIVQYNEAYLNKDNGNDHDKGAYDCDHHNNDCLFQYNYSHNNDGGMIQLFGLKGGFNNNAVFRYNISQNDGEESARLVGRVTGAKIYNNTFFNGSDSSPEVVTGGSDTGYTPTGTQIVNNIFYNEGPVRSGYFYHDMTFANNVFYRVTPPSSSSAVRVSGTLTSDPRLVNPGSGGTGRGTVGGYKLLAGSPALDAGVVVASNGGQDYWGNPVSSSSAPNIGAYNGGGVTRSYYLVSKEDGRYLANDTATNSARVWTPSPINTRRWDVVDAGRNYVYLVSKEDGRYLANDTAASDARVWTPSTLDTRKWRFVSAGGGDDYLVSKEDGHYLANRTTDHDARVWTPSTLDTRKWHLEPVN